MILYLDVDGVLANFHDAAVLAHGWDPDDPGLQGWDFYRAKGLTAEQFWAPIDNFEFWLWAVNPHPWAWELVHRLREAMDPDPVVLCTVPSRNPLAYAAKLFWLRRQPWWLNDDVILMPGHKERLASHKAILIDDNDGNAEAFALAGGYSVLFPQPWNKLHVKPNPETVVQDVVDRVKGVLSIYA